MVTLAGDLPLFTALKIRLSEILFPALCLTVTQGRSEAVLCFACLRALWRHPPRPWFAFPISAKCISSNDSYNTDESEQVVRKTAALSIRPCPSVVAVVYECWAVVLLWDSRGQEWSRHSSYLVCFVVTGTSFWIGYYPWRWKTCGCDSKKALRVSPIVSAIILRLYPAIGAQVDFKLEHYKFTERLPWVSNPRPIWKATVP